jgi:hypothetical protein
MQKIILTKMVLYSLLSVNKYSALYHCPGLSGNIPSLAKQCIVYALFIINH